MSHSENDHTDMAVVLDQIAMFIHRFVVLSDVQADTIALWVAHTWCVDAADTTPYIAVTSAEKRSGKTRLLEVLELLVRKPLPTANISDAALFRAIAELGPTLLLDEIDAIFGPKARDREDLRGMLNAGYRRGAAVQRMGGAKMTTLEAFPVFCPKAFAGIGELPDTIPDRSIRIRLERRTREEPIERFRRRDVDEVGGAAADEPRERDGPSLRQALLRAAAPPRRARRPRAGLLGAAARDRRPGGRRLARPCPARGAGALRRRETREDESLERAAARGHLRRLRRETMNSGSEPPT